MRSKQYFTSIKNNPHEISTDPEKDDLIGIVRTKMYLCHITLLMLKDTKSLGNNKASAWESRGFVIKKEGMHFDTPSSVDVDGFEPPTLCL